LSDDGEDKNVQLQLQHQRHPVSSPPLALLVPEPVSE
jgi:hypothetical protein